MAIAPAALLLLFVVIQMSLLYYGQSVATAAAQHAIDAARVRNATEGDGTKAANEFLDQAGGIHVTDMEVKRGANNVRVTITADPLEVLPGFPFDISVELEAPVERVVN